MSMRLLGWLSPTDNAGTAIDDERLRWAAGATYTDGTGTVVADSLISKYQSNVSAAPGVCRLLSLPTSIARYDTTWPSQLVSGSDKAAAITWMDAFFGRLDAQGYDLNTILLDHEDSGLKTWRIFSGLDANEREAKMQTLWDDVSAFPMVPQNIRDDYLPSDFRTDTDQSDDSAINAWNQFAGYQNATDLRAVVQARAEAVLGHDVEIANYNDAYPAWSIYDRNGWLRSVGGVNRHRRVSSPSLYMDTQTARYNGYSKHWMWQAFIDVVNIMLSCVAGGGLVRPWFPGADWPTSGNTHPDKLVRGLLHLSYAAGVREGNVFNNVTATPDRGIATTKILGWLEEMDDIAIVPFRPQPIAFDADVVQVGNVMVAYRDVEGDLP